MLAQGQAFRVSPAANLFGDVSMTHAFGLCSSCESRHAIALQRTEQLLRHSHTFMSSSVRYRHECSGSTSTLYTNHAMRVGMLKVGVEGGNTGFRGLHDMCRTWQCGPA